MIDAFDRKIIATLQRDARITIAQLAQEVSLSATPVSRRVRALEEAGVITGYVPRLDARKLGLELEAFVLINLDRHEDAIIAGFEARIAENPYVIACHAVTGDNDYLLNVVARNVDHLSEITLKTLLRIPGVRDLKSIIALESVKRARGIPVE